MASCVTLLAPVLSILLPPPLPLRLQVIQAQAELSVEEGQLAGALLGERGESGLGLEAGDVVTQPQCGDVFT